MTSSIDVVQFHQCKIQNINPTPFAAFPTSLGQTCKLSVCYCQNTIVDCLAFAELPAAIRGGELGSEDQEITVLPLLHPLADPLLRLFVLAAVGSVIEVATSVIVGVEELEGLGLVHALPMNPALFTPTRSVMSDQICRLATDNEIADFEL
jgi:hypothetical protein